MNQHILKLRILLLSNKIYLFLFIIVTIYSLLLTNYYIFKSDYNGNEKEFIGIIQEYNIDGNKLSIEFFSKEKLKCIYYFKTEEELNYFSNNINLGDKLKITGNLELPESNSIPNTFNYKKYLYNNKIFYILNIEEYKLLRKNKNILIILKNKILNRIKNIKNNEYIYAFVLGETFYIDNEINETYRKNGVTHLFALSGTNVSLIALLISYVLKKFKVSELKTHLIIFIFLIFVNFITNFCPSMLRATVFFFLYGLNRIFYFHIKTINILLLTYFILVLINPFIIYDLGFQLSFIVTFFLILSNKFLNSKKYFKNLCFISIISFLSSLPIIIYNFYYINFMSIINNIFYVPYVSLIVFPFSLIVFIFPIFNNIFIYVILIMEKVSIFINNLNICSFNYPKVSIIFILFYYFFLIFIITKKNKKYKFCMLLILIINYFIPYLENNYYIYFLDVGQGDSILITTPHLKNVIMIDVGGTVSYDYEKWKEKNKKFSIVKSSIIPFLNSIGIKNIDYLFFTHGDYDHIGNAKELINNFKVDKIFINQGNINTLEKDIINANIFKEKSIIIEKLSIYSLNNKIYNNENDNSLVFLIKIEDYKILLMGDASIKVEKDIIDNINIKNIDILKVGHHGSDSSTSKEFLDYIRPKKAVISVGKNNKFNHPSERVVNLLEHYNIEIFNTIKDNTIKFKIN